MYKRQDNSNDIIHHTLLPRECFIIKIDRKVLSQLEKLVYMKETIVITEQETKPIVSNSLKKKVIFYNNANIDMHTIL